MLNRDDIIAELMADFKNRDAIENIARKHGSVANDGYPVIYPIIKLIGDSAEYERYDTYHSGKRYHPAHKWSEADMRCLTALRFGGATYDEIARTMKIGRTTIYKQLKLMGIVKTA